VPHASSTARRAMSSRFVLNSTPAVCPPCSAHTWVRPPAMWGREHDGRPELRSIELRGATPEADPGQHYRGAVRLVTGFCSLFVIAVVASGCSRATSSAPASKSTTTAELPSATSEPPPIATTELPSTATPLYSIEQCGGITTSSDLHPNVDNRTLLLAQADGPRGYVYGPARMASGPSVTASVPSYAPAVYESFQVPVGEGGGGGQEVIGEVDSSNAASQMAQQVEAHLVSCYGGKQLLLPRTVPGVTAETYQYGLSRFDGLVRSATVTVAKGTYIVSLQWTNSNTCTTYGGGSCPAPPTMPPPMPSTSDMAELVNAALAKIR
jgi:hypothetical protein